MILYVYANLEKIANFFRMSSRTSFKVAGHVFEIYCCAESKVPVTSLMENYIPFSVDEDEGPSVFSLEIAETSKEVEYTEDTRQLDEGQEIICGRTSDGLPVFEYYTGNIKTGIHVCSRDFSKGWLYFSRELESLSPTKIAHLKKYALNNSVMVQYALSTACEYTALFHSAVVMREGKGYLFLGKSGTGKSTHARMWLARFKDAELLNDDNPVVRIEQDGIWVYGSPWSGKTPCYKNCRAKIAGIVDLSQAPQNEIRPIKGIEAYMALVVSISGMRWNKKIADGLHDTENRLAQEVRMFHLDCLPNENAAEVCHAAF